MPRFHFNINDERDSEGSEWTRSPKRNVRQSSWQGERFVKTLTCFGSAWSGRHSHEVGAIELQKLGPRLLSAAAWSYGWLPGTPAVIGRIDLDDGRALRLGESLLERILGLGLLLIVVARDCDDETRLRLGNEEVRAVGVLGHETAAVKGCNGADAVRASGSGAERERAAEAIALHARGLAFVGRLLLVEKGEVRRRVPINRCVRQRLAFRGARRSWTCLGSL